jgi:DNA polymerase-3 subunit alpha
MTSPFVHLRVHTEYSLLDSVIRIQSEHDDKGKTTVLGLMDAVANAGMPAVALTDQGNLFAMVKFYREAMARGVKPIIGVDLRVREVGERVEPSRLVLLCQNDIGYRNLTRLVSESYLRGQIKGVPTIQRSWLTQESARGLIALSAGREGDIGRALIGGREAEAHSIASIWSCIAPAVKARTCISRALSILQFNAVCPWSRPTMCAFWSAAISKRMKHAPAFITACCSRIRSDRDVTANSNI